MRFNYVTPVFAKPDCPFEEAKQIFEIVSQMRSSADQVPLDQIPLFQKIYALSFERKKLTFILPAFPAKSANRNKTIGDEPDYADVLGLRTLQAMASKLQNIYSPGVEIVICSDGRVFNDIVLVSDEALMTYKSGIKSIIAHERLDLLKVYSLDDCFKHQDYQLMRLALEQEYAISLDQIRYKMKSSPTYQSLFNGIHRFIKEDMQAICLNLSKNKLMEQSKEIAYKVLQRSGAWDGLLEKKFPETIRLSIHPYPITHQKFGIKLVESSDRWATPWHNVALQIGDSFQLVKRQQAIHFGAKLNWAEGEYAFYKL